VNSGCVSQELATPTGLEALFWPLFS